VRTVVNTATVTVNLNDAAITRAVEDAFQETNRALEPLFDLEFTRAKWAWPVSPSPRDIVDTGVLRQSYVPTRVNPRLYEHAWNTEYAVAVHEGYRTASSSMPGRPWTKEPAERFTKLFEPLARRRLERT
jgi:hypothetical protein